MAYVHVLDFRGGLDRRKSIVTLEAGALYQADNVLLTRGNEIEKRRAFEGSFPLPAGTIGLATTATNAYVFGSGAAPAGMPGGIIYQQLVPSAGYVWDILDYDLFNGMLYVTAVASDGNIYHFYNGVRVVSWTAPTILKPAALGAKADFPTYAAPVLTLGNRMYAGHGRILFLSALGNPDFWTPGDTTKPGAGFIELSNQSGTDENIVSLAVYQGNLAVFMRDTIQIWRVDPDPAKHQLLQVMSNIGAYAPRSVMPFGDSDVFFLADSGLRSLRARDSSNNAVTSDIGTPIDLLLHGLRVDFPEGVFRARSVIEPDTGRYWVSIGDQIYAFSFFPGSKVSGWTRLLPGFSISDLEYLTDLILARSGDMIYVYDTGGTVFGNTYACDLILPMLDAGSPAASKGLQGMDLVTYGAWSVDLGTDPANPDARERVATVTKPTYGLERLAVTGYGTHFGLRITHQGDGPALLASVLLQFQQGEED